MTILFKKGGSEGGTDVVSAMSCSVFYMLTQCWDPLDLVHQKRYEVVSTVGQYDITRKISKQQLRFSEARGALISMGLKRALSSSGYRSKGSNCEKSRQTNKLVGARAKKWYFASCSLYMNDLVTVIGRMCTSPISRMPESNLLMDPTLALGSAGCQRRCDPVLVHMSIVCSLGNTYLLQYPKIVSIIFPVEILECRIINKR